MKKFMQSAIVAQGFFVVALLASTAIYGLIPTVTTEGCRQILTEMVPSINTIETAVECLRIPVTAPTTITTPGSYCLANDINGDIIVDGNNITLDLNGYTVNANNVGIRVQNSSEVVVKNGYIRNETAGGACLFIEFSDSVLATDMVCTVSASVFIGCNCYVNSSRSCTIQNSEIYTIYTGAATCAGIDFVGTAYDVLVKNCNIHNFNGYGVLINSGINNIIVENCSIRTCQFDGILVGSSTNGCIFRNNLLVGNGYGITLDGSEHIVYTNTVLDCQETDGITTFAINNASTGSYVYGNFAANNASGVIANYTANVPLQVVASYLNTTTNSVSQYANISL